MSDRIVVAVMNLLAFNSSKALVGCLLLVCAILCVPVYAAARVPAFPGAEGAGAYAKGGRGGKVLFVTNLRDYDPEKEKPIPGSLRAAIDAKGPRVVIFHISGTIPLEAALRISEPYITIPVFRDLRVGELTYRFPRSSIQSNPEIPKRFGAQSTAPVA